MSELAVEDWYFQVAGNCLFFLKYLVNLCILDSTRINLNFESLSFKFLLKCLRMDTAFLIKKYRSSGISGANPK